MGLPHQYPMDTYPYARTVEEEDYFRRVHYLASTLHVFGAAEDVLIALGEVWQQVMDRQASTSTSSPSPA